MQTLKCIGSLSSNYSEFTFQPNYKQICNLRPKYNKEYIPIEKRPECQYMHFLIQYYQSRQLQIINAQ